jgi:hypothetical protein
LLTLSNSIWISAETKRRRSAMTIASLMKGEKRSAFSISLTA